MRTALTDGSKRKPLGRLIGVFKTISTKHLHQTDKTNPTTIWQRNYYDHIIRNEDEVNRIREYFIQNPLQWRFDRENPCGISNADYQNRWTWLEGD
jgi:REP element-mobilizing transposase RayT